MGGYGSGRWNWHNKKIQVEECYKWSIYALKPYLIPGFSGASRWLQGEREIASISFYVQGNDYPTAVRLKYTKYSGSKNEIEIDYRVNLTTTQLAWGGVRYWFICPLQGCQKRVGCLYLPSGGKYFGCRHCYDLTYKSRQDGNWERHFFGEMALGLQREYPGITWRDYRDLMDGRQTRRIRELLLIRALQQWQKYDPYEGYLTKEQLLQQSGLTIENLKELEDKLNSKTQTLEDFKTKIEKLEASMVDKEELCAAIFERLSSVIDPETGVDVVRMRLIEDLVADADGRVVYKFRPSSPLCPIAVPLSLMIQEAVASVSGVTGQDMQIVGYIQAEELTALLREMLEDMGYSS